MSKKIFKDANYPTFEITFEEDGNSGVRLVSLVKDPAIDEYGMYFSKEEIMNYEFKEIKDKQMIVGPAMIPNKKILRKDEDGDPFYVFFSAETIKGMMEKFNANNTGKSINVDHTNQMAPGFITQNWLIEDPYYDKSKMYGYNLPIGTWFICCKITDENFWNTAVKEEGRYSFSVEGLMGQKPSNKFSSINDLTDEKLIDDLTDEELIDDLTDDELILLVTDDALIKFIKNI